MIPSFLSKYNILLLFFDKCSYLPQPCKAQLPGTAAGKPAAWGGRRRFAGPGPLAPGLQNQRSGGLPFGRPPPLCARPARPPPPHVPPKPRPPLPEGRLHPSLALLRTGPSGPSALYGGGGGGRAAPLPAGGQRPPPGPFGGRRPPNAAAPPRQRWIPHYRQVVMPPSFSCGTDPPPGR